MATTTLLDIDLLATGSRAGLWGNDTNANWQKLDNFMNILTGKGDMIARGSTKAWVRVPASTDGFVLSLDSTQAAGVKWITSPGGVPSGAAGGSLAGTYPNPSIALLAVGTAQLAAGAVDNSKVSAGAAIAESKLALNFATHSNALDHSNANDPSAGEKAALAGTSGTPSGANKYVTNADARVISSPIGGTGTVNMLPKFSAATTLTNSIIFDDGFFVGIGTTNPSGRLEIMSDGSVAYMYITSYSTTSADNRINFQRARGSLSSPSALALSDDIGSVYFRAWDGNNFNTAAYILTEIDGAVSVGVTPSRMSFYLEDSAGSGALRFRINGEGEATIDKKLRVGGGVPSSSDAILHISYADPTAYTPVGARNSATGGSIGLLVNNQSTVGGSFSSIVFGTHDSVSSMSISYVKGAEEGLRVAKNIGGTTTDAVYLGGTVLAGGGAIGAYSTAGNHFAETLTAIPGAPLDIEKNTVSTVEPTGIFRNRANSDCFIRMGIGDASGASFAFGLDQSDLKKFKFTGSPSSGVADLDTGSAPLITLDVSGSFNMVGIGLNAPHSKFHASGSWASTSDIITGADLLLNENHFAVYFVTSGSNRNANLPDATSIVGRMYIIKNSNASVENVIVDPFLTQEIESGGASSTITLHPGDSVIIQAVTPTSWDIVASHVTGSI